MQVPSVSAAAKAGLLPTRRGLAGNIILGDVIVGVGDSTVSHCSANQLFFLMTKSAVVATQLALSFLSSCVVSEQIKNAGELSKVLDNYQVGDDITVKVYRNDQVVELPFTLEESQL